MGTSRCSVSHRRRIQCGEVRRAMKNQFNRFVLRFLFAVLAGLVLLLLHGPVQGGPFAAFVPQHPSAWELSKLAFWPMLLSCLATGRLAKEHIPLARTCPPW